MQEAVLSVILSPSSHLLLEVLLDNSRSVKMGNTCQLAEHCVCCSGFIWNNKNKCKFCECHHYNLCYSRAPSIMQSVKVYCQTQLNPSLTWLSWVTFLSAIFKSAAQKKTPTKVINSDPCCTGIISCFSEENQDFGLNLHLKLWPLGQLYPLRSLSFGKKIRPSPRLPSWKILSAC